MSSSDDSSDESWEERKQRIFQELQEERREREAEYHRKKYYDQARTFADDLHPEILDQTPPEILDQNKQEDEEAKTLFQEAIETVKNRATSISPMEFDLSTSRREPPSLSDLSLRALAKHSDSIESLTLVPDHLRKKLSYLVGNSGKLNLGFVKLLIQDSPSDVYITNCVDLKEEDMINILCELDRDSLEVLNLDLCGRSITKNAIFGFLRRTSYLRLRPSYLRFPSLTTLSLRAAFCLTDTGLELISRSAPNLRFINLELCSLLTSHAIEILADEFESTLEGLNIGECQGIKPDFEFNLNLVRFTELKYLSVAGHEGITDLLIQLITSSGSNLTDLSLCSCNDVTEELISAIGRCCPNLETLDISDLDELTDASLESLAEGCRFLKSFILTRTRFSDEAIAAFIEVSGSSLTQLGLNKVGNVGMNTAISLGKVCKKLQYLDLSWCRKLTEEELRWIIRCCWSLRSLKLFGFSEMSNEFVEELSRSHIRITGLKMTSLYAHLDDPFPRVDDKFF